MTIRCGFSVFCDDIRHETTGKLSLIGAYTGRMFVESFPITLPKLCIYVVIQTPVDRPFDDLLVKVVKGGKVLGEIKVDPADLKRVPYEEKIPVDAPTVRTSRLLFSFSPLEFKEPCSILVRAHSGDEEIKAGGLVVRLIDEIKRPKTDTPPS